MSREKAKSLMRRAGLADDPLAHCRTIQEFKLELAKLSDAQLLDVWGRTQGERATRLSDEELLAELDQARKEVVPEQDNNHDPTIVVG